MPVPFHHSIILFIALGMVCTGCRSTRTQPTAVSVGTIHQHLISDPRASDQSTSTPTPQTVSAIQLAGFQDVVLGRQNKNEMTSRNQGTGNEPTTNSDANSELRDRLESDSTKLRSSHSKSDEKPNTGLLSPLESNESQNLLGPLTLSDAIQMALEQNPDLAAARAAQPVANAALEVAQTYIYNPQFQTQILPISRDPSGADGSVSQQHVIVQTFERGGQQQFREGAAMATVGQVNDTIHAAELTNMALTTRLYFTAIYQRELRDLSQTLADMNESLVGVTERRAAAGQANASDVELAKLQSLASQRQLRLAIANYRTAIRALETQLNWNPQTEWELFDPWANAQWQSVAAAFGIESELSSAVDIDTDIAGWEFTIGETALRQMVSQRPDVLAARAAARVAAENRGLANAMRIPSVQAGPMFQRDAASTVYWGVQAQFDIPVVNTGRPLVQQRCAELRQQQIVADQLAERAMLEARAAIARYERAMQQVLISEKEFSGTISDSLKVFEDQFKAGQITVLQVFAARSTLTQSRQGHFDLLNEISLAAADVTQATGLDPQRLLRNTP